MRDPPQNGHDVADVIRGKTQELHAVFFMLSHTAKKLENAAVKP